MGRLDGKGGISGVMRLALTHMKDRPAAISRKRLEALGIPICEPRKGARHPDAAWKRVGPHYVMKWCPNCGWVGGAERNDE